MLRSVGRWHQLPQLFLYPGQTGVTDAGETAFKWYNILLENVGGTVTWSIDGLDIGVVDTAGLTLGGGNIFFGHSDTNGFSSTNPNNSLLNVTLIDNIVVDVIPEPSSGLLALAGCLAMVSRRRR